MIEEKIESDFGLVLRAAPGDRLDDLDVASLKRLGRELGAVIFFGFHADLEAFERFSNRLCSNWQGYRGGAHDKKVLNPQSDGTILSSNFYFGQANQLTCDLALHADMAYQKNFPQVLFLYCVAPAGEKGETTLCDGARFLRELSPATRRFFESQRIKYVRTIRPQGRMVRMWTEDEHEAREFCRQNGLTMTVEPETGNWITEYVVSAIRTSMWGREVFNNNILPVLDQEDEGSQASLVRMEDGSKIPSGIVAELRAIAERIPYLIRWQAPGDFALLDNTRALHGRRQFTDQRREIAQRLAASVDW